MRTGLLAIFVLVSALVFGTPIGAQDACTLCDSAHVIACPGCGGKGVKSLPCTFCKGEGKRDCRACKDGKVRCTNYACQKGKVGVRGAMKDCKACPSGGRLDCKSCVGGKSACVCDKQRARTIACTDCAGTKRIPCPACRLQPFTDSCGVCSDTKRRACGLCKSDDRPSAPCVACSDKRKVPCKRCRGHRKLACTQCSGRGVAVQRTTVKKKSVFKSKRCRGCKGRGTKACTGCERATGWVACRACESRGDHCGLCRKGQLPCGMCTDGPLAIARHLVDAKRTKLAHEYVVATRKRLESLRTKIDAEHEQALRAIAALNDKAKKDGGKRKPADFSRSLALARQVGVLRAAKKDLEKALARSKALLAELRTKAPTK